MPDAARRREQAVHAPRTGADAATPARTQPMPGSKVLSLQRVAGNRAVAALISGARPPVHRCGDVPAHECDCHHDNNDAVQRAPARALDAPAGPQQTSALLVDDDVTALRSGQQHKSAFLRDLQTAVCADAEQVLAGSGWTTDGCPYLTVVFDYYRTRSSAHVEEVLHAYTPETRTATSASEYIDLVLPRIRRAVVHWNETGEIMGVPDDAPSALQALTTSAEETHAQGVQRAARRESARASAGVPQLLRRLDRGTPLDSTVASRFGAAMGADFSQVRLHTGGDAAGVASQLGARAFTYGRHVGFDAGEYRPGTLTGDAVLAHELAHVQQQRIAATTVDLANRNEHSDDDSELESERQADRTAARTIARLRGITGDVVDGVLRAPQRLRAARPRLQRCTSCSSCASGGPTPAPSGTTGTPTPAPSPPPGPTAAPSDYLIEGVSSRAASSPDEIFFERNRSTIPPSEGTKIHGIANPTSGSATDPLALYGYSSEDETNKSALAQARLTAVESAVVAASPSGASTPSTTDRHGDTAGRIDYREVRMVEAVRGTTSSPPASAQPTCQPGVSTTVPCTPQQTTVLNSGVTQGASWIQTARDKVNAGDAAAMRLVADLFHGGISPVPAAVKTALVTKLDAWKAHLANLNQASRHECRQCGDCENTPAFNNGVGGTAKMTLCPTWLDGGTQDAIATLIHEAGHGTAGVQTTDHAYGHSRRILALTQTEALENTDSFVLLVRSLNGHSVSIGPRRADDVSALNASEKRHARRTLGWVENHLVQAYQLLSDTYAYVKDSRDHSRWESGWGHTGMHKVSSRLPGLGTPGAVGSSPGPTAADQYALAAIHDRYHKMRAIMWGKPIRFVKGAADSWSSGPGDTVTLSPGFFALTPRQQLDRLLELIVAATPGISSALEPGYRQLIDDLRQARGVGSP